MRRLLAITYLFLSSFWGILFAQEPDSVQYSMEIGEVTIKYRPPIKLGDIGVNGRKIDSVALRESISVSLADLLSRSSSVFVKSYGRATLSTVSFRGASPSHTQVAWNGMKINSPMVGMVDFSLIPSYFIDEVGIYSGSGSVNIAGGSIGGSIALSTKAPEAKGFKIQYLQGVGSYGTFDQYADFAFGRGKFQSSTRIYYVTSKNNFEYTNYRKKIFITNELGEVIDFYYPIEKNKNGSFNDLHFMQELFLKGDDGSSWGASFWYMDSRRGVPLLNVDYKNGNNSRNRQNEKTLRSVVTWDKNTGNSLLSAKFGYTGTHLNYLFLGDTGYGDPQKMVDSHSTINSFFGEGKIDIETNEKWMITGGVSLYQHFVKSIDNAIAEHSTTNTIIGYNKARFEVSANIMTKYMPTKRLGVAINLKEDMYGTDIISPVPAIFLDYLVSYKGDIKLKASLSRNHRYPTLNDLYFMPGGNDSLKTEKGTSFDIGFDFGIEKEKVAFSGGITLFDSRIKDWIMWLPTYKGFWSPINIKKVHSYGIESEGELTLTLPEGIIFSIAGNFSVTRSINMGEPLGQFDLSVGKQLVYIPVYSSAFTGNIDWKKWFFVYKWNYYSERYTTSSNEISTKIGKLPPYFMSDVSIGRDFSTQFGIVSLKFMINNLLDEEYESVLSRPMAGRNWGIYLGVNPSFSRK